MSFATRCTACGTIFRVVQDQLRVSEGWVRCGRCAEVFDAREQLFDIDRDAPPVWAGDAIVATPAAEQSPVSVADFEPPEVPLDDEPPQSQAPPLATVPIPASVAAQARQEPHWPDAQSDVDEGWGLTRGAERRRLTTDADVAAISQMPAEYLADSLSGSAETAAGRAAELPSFMRPAEAAPRWQGPGARLMVAGVAALLLVALVLQLLIHFRDAIAAVYPQALPGLQALCQTSGCKVRAWRRIEALSVENSALTQTGNGANGGAAKNRYQLTLSLHNKSGVAVAAPAIELSLLNPNGAVVLRRVLNPADFQQERGNAAPLIAIAPGADLPLQLQLTTGTQRISGYNVEIFHP